MIIHVYCIIAYKVVTKLMQMRDLDDLVVYWITKQCRVKSRKLSFLGICVILWMYNWQNSLNS